MISKPDKDTTKKHNYKQIFLMNVSARILMKYLQTDFVKKLKGSYTIIKLAFFYGCKNDSTYAHK
jgi:hypothetical protein